MKRILMIAVLFAVMTIPTTFAAEPQTTTNAETSNVLKITASNYRTHAKNNKILVVDFWASWCGPCRAIAPIIEELATEYKGKVAIGKCNVDENSSLTGSFGVRGIPAIYFIVDGDVVDEQIGLCSKEELKAKIDNLVNLFK